MTDEGDIGSDDESSEAMFLENYNSFEDFLYESSSEEEEVVCIEPIVYKPHFFAKKS